MVSPPSPDSANIAIAENKQFKAPLLLTRYQNKGQLRRERILETTEIFTPFGLFGPCQYKYTTYFRPTSQQIRDTLEIFCISNMSPTIK